MVCPVKTWVVEVPVESVTVRGDGVGAGGGVGVGDGRHGGRGAGAVTEGPGVAGDAAEVGTRGSRHRTKSANRGVLPWP